MIPRCLSFILKDVVCSHQIRSSNVTSVRTLIRPNYQRKNSSTVNGSSQPFRQFVPDENNFLFSVINVRPSIDCEFDQSTFESVKQSANQCQQDVLNQLIDFLRLDATQRVDQFSNLFHRLQEQCKHLDDHQLMLVMNCLCSDSNLGRQMLVNSVYTFFDNEFSTRIANTPFPSKAQFDLYFQVSGLLFDAYIGKLNRLSGILLERSLLTKHYLRDKNSFLRTIFLLNLTRRPAPSHFCNVIEKHVCHLLSTKQLNSDELALLAVGFFKTRTKLRTQTVELLIDYLVQNIEDIQNSIAAACILKGIRYSNLLPDKNKVETLLNKLIPHLSRFDIKVNFHLLLISKQYKCRHDKLIQFTIENMMTNFPVEEIRIKDVDRLLRTLTFFNVPKNERLLQFIEKSLNSNDQKLEYPLSFVSILSDMAVYDHFPTDLLEYFFGDKMMKHIDLISKDCAFNLHLLSTMLKLKRPDLFALYRTIIERLERTIGNSEIINCFAVNQSIDLINFSSQLERWLDQKPNPTNIERMLIQYFNTCKQTLVNCDVQLLPILPFSHYPEIVITRADRSKIEHVSIQKNAFNSDDHRIIVIENRNCYQDTFNKQPNGLHVLRISCLKELGFNVVRLSYQDAIAALKTNQLKSRVQLSLNSR